MEDYAAASEAIVTHDSGSPRDQLLPMYVTKKPRLHGLGQVAPARRWPGPGSCVGPLLARRRRRASWIVLWTERRRWSTLRVPRVHFSAEGTCVDMPNDPVESDFKHKVAAPAYGTREHNGVIWCFLRSRHHSRNCSMPHPVIFREQSIMLLSRR